MRFDPVRTSESHSYNTDQITQLLFFSLSIFKKKVKWTKPDKWAKIHAEQSKSRTWLGVEKKLWTTNNNQQINRNCAFRSGRNRRIAFLPAALAPAEVEHQQVDTPEPVEVHLHRSPVVTGWYWISVKWRRFRRSTFICFVLLCYVFVCCFFFFSLFCRSVIYIYIFFHSLKFPFPPPPSLIRFCLLLPGWFHLLPLPVFPLFSTESVGNF